MDKEKEKILDVLNDWFGVDTPDGTYTYMLTRCKEAFSVGTMTLDDFVEISEEDINDLADYIVKNIRKEG